MTRLIKDKFIKIRIILQGANAMKKYRRACEIAQVKERIL